MSTSMKRLGLVLLVGIIVCSCSQEPEPVATPLQPEPVPTEEPLFLARNGVSEYQIVVSPLASPSEKRAAEELKSYVEACTGVALPSTDLGIEIVSGEALIPENVFSDDTPMIVLGCGPVAAMLGIEPSPEELGEQGYVIRTVSPHLVIAGTPAAGTMYGVYDFLEKTLGVRWYAPGVTKTPAVAELPLPEVDELVAPSFQWRQTSYTWPGGDADFLAHVRANSGGGGADHPFGIQHNHDGRCHSYFRYVSPGEFFAEHPEYFSDIGGVRREFETQLCLTNPEVFDIVAERMLARMAESPGARQHNFSQMDWYNYCECGPCTEINEQYGGAGGTQFWFVNKLAERTAEVFPDKLIGTLAYIYTEEPPKDVDMHPNVAVWLCHMFPSCDSHPIATCPLNADYKRRALAWSEKCQHLYIWHYITDFAHYYNPFPNFRAMAADMRFYRDIGVEGVYQQAMGHSGGGGEFSLLRPYYGMQLLRDPDQDPEAILRDFLEGYYGAAWQPIYEYVTLLHDKVENENIHMHLYTNPAQGYLPDEVIAKAMALFDQAEAAVASDAELLERVRVARMPLTYARVFPRNGFTIENGKLQFQGDRATPADVTAFIDRMKQHGFATIRESGGDPAQLNMWAMAVNTPLPVPRIESEHLAIDVFPILGGRALRIIEKTSGECVTAYDVRRCLFYPFMGGEECRIGGQFLTHIVGNMEPYTVVEHTDSAMTIETKAGGFAIRRAFTLAADKPVLTIQTTVTNITDKPKEARLRSHMEYDLGDLAQTRVRFTTRSGETVDQDITKAIAGLREGEHFLDERVPKGGWTFSGTKGLQFTQTFDDVPVDFTWLIAYPDYLGELEAEVWLKAVTLEPDESVSFSQDFDVKPM